LAAKPEGEQRVRLCIPIPKDKSAFLVDTVCTLSAYKTDAVRESGSNSGRAPLVMSPNLHPRGGDAIYRDDQPLPLSGNNARALILSPAACEVISRGSADMADFNEAYFETGDDVYTVIESRSHPDKGELPHRSWERELRYGLYNKGVSFKASSEGFRHSDSISVGREDLRILGSELKRFIREREESLAGGVNEEIMPEGKGGIPPDEAELSPEEGQKKKTAQTLMAEEALFQIYQLIAERVKPPLPDFPEKNHKTVKHMPGLKKDFMCVVMALANEKDFPSLRHKFSVISDRMSDVKINFGAGRPPKDKELEWNTFYRVLFPEYVAAIEKAYKEYQKQVGKKSPSGK
jgi:hypothetical protein